MKQSCGWYFITSVVAKDQCWGVEGVLVQLRKGGHSRRALQKGSVGSAEGRPGSGHSDHVGLMSLQASDKLGPTQIVKIVTRKLPQLSLSQDDAKLAQRILLEVFATNKDVRPFFTLGIVSSIICDMGTSHSLLL
jgi:hypothetical protein